MGAGLGRWGRGGGLMEMGFWRWGLYKTGSRREGVRALRA